MLFFHLLVTFFSPNQIFQQKRLLPNQAFVISLCNLILFLAVHFSLLKLLIYKFLFVQTLHIKMTKKLNVNQPLCMQLFCRYMHVNAAIPLVCTVKLRIFFRVLFFTYTILFVNKFWLEKDVDRHEQSPPFYTIQPFTRLKEQRIHTSTNSKPQAKCPYAEATAFLP